MTTPETTPKITQRLEKTRMAIISEESKKAIIISQMYTPEKFNANGAWVPLAHASYTYHLALQRVINELKKDPFAHLRIEALERTNEGVHVRYDAYF